MSRLDPTNNINDFDRLVDLISTPIHQSKRRGVLKSHLKHANQFVDGSRREFVSFVTKRFLASIESGREPSVGYTLGVIQSLQRHFKLTNFNKADVYKCMNALRKIYNGESTDPIFFNAAGENFTVDTSTAKLPKNPKVTVFTDVEFDAIYSFYSKHLDNFLYSSKSAPTIDDELAMIVSFFCAGPYRASEVMNLTYAKVLDLLLKASTTIKSKSGTMVADMIIPTLLSDSLELYIKRMPQPIGKDERVFRHSYNQYYKLYKRNLASIFPYSVSGAFHAFRSFFAGKADTVDSDVTKDAMNHATQRMTNRYINKQRKVGRRDRIRKLMEKMSVRWTS